MISVTLFLIGGHTLTYQCSPGQARELVDGYANACQHESVVGAWRLPDPDSGIERTIRARDVVAIETRPAK